MNSVKSLTKRAAIFLLALFVSVGSVGQQASAASVPKIGSTQSQHNILALMSAYDKDGAYLTKYAMGGDGFYSMLLFSYINPDDHTIDTLDTVAHESFHEFSMPTYNNDPQVNNGEKIYIGNKKSVNVTFTPVFRTKEMASSVPKRCRTAHYHYENGDRFSTYVRDVSGNMISDWYGVYGLLNEFTGYCWGLNSTVSMFDYRDKYKDTVDTWSSFVLEGESDRLAYIEFKYYILHYMYYAKQHHPSEYRQIVANDRFRKAYRLIDRRYADEIDQYEAQLEKVNEKMTAAGHPLDMKKLTLRKQYDTMQKEVKKKQYAQIQKILTR